MTHNSSSNSIFMIALNLTAACLISGVIIASVYYLTHDTAVRKQEEMRNNSMRQLIAGANRFEEIKTHKGWFKAFEGDKFAAYIVPAESKGYAGTIKMLVAVSATGTVLNFSILDSKETPGLGDKAGTPMFRERLIGKNAEHLQVTKDPANHADVLAITGATITSRAVTVGVKEAVERVNSFVRGK